MRITGLTLMAAVAAVSGWAGAVPMKSRQLTVCMERAADDTVAYQARLTSGIFAAIGVKIQWLDPLTCPTGAIYVSFSRVTPVSVHPGALAYAMTDEGARIVVLLDRVERIASCASSRVLAYTLAHEITHILQGVVRHSESGIMKARWGHNDLYRMSQGWFGFSAEDIGLIYQGLDRRESRLAPWASTSRASEGSPFMR